MSFHLYTLTDVECLKCREHMDFVERDKNPANEWDEEMPDSFYECPFCGSRYDEQMEVIW